MAINVLVIPEDFRKDQFVLKPIVEQMMRSVGVTARVTVCKDPLFAADDSADGGNEDGGADEDEDGETP